MVIEKTCLKILRLSNEASSQRDQRKPGLLKSSLGFITTSLAAAVHFTIAR